MGHRRRSAVFTIAATLFGLMGCAPSKDAAAPNAPPGASTIPLGPSADFAFDSLDERAVTAGTTRGKPTVLCFVTTSSLPAQAQVDFLIAMAKHDGSRVNYAVIALETPDNRELVELYQKSLGIPFPVALADKETLLGRGPFGDVFGIPVTLLLDRTGRVVWRVEGRVAKSAEIRESLHGL